MGIVGMILSSNEALKLAHQIAQAAACLDDFRTAPVDGATYFQCRKAATDHVDMLHNIAIMLAGVRVNEVYAPDDNSLSLIQAAGLSMGTEDTECANT